MWSERRALVLSGARRRATAMEDSKQGDPQALVDALANPGQREDAARALSELGARGRAAVRAGLGDGRWEVRRQCAFWLLRAPEPEDVAALAPLLRDPRSRVRQAAVIAVGHKRGADRAGEIVPLLVERALHDESARVRRQALALLVWEHAHPDLEGFFAGLLETERDPVAHKYAGIGTLRCRELATRARAEGESC
jgi:HEAT repeat protein